MSEPGTAKSGIKYRPDIDGLRAIAVLSVLAFHLGVWLTPGGFVGVDIFFVISGYLISAIMFAEIAASRFSVLGFYERRIRRIFPALFGMLLVFSVVAWFYLLPTEFVDYAKSLLAATTSSSNFYFWRHSGYFDTPLSKPLLHTWSLAVEEQFYILFPIFLVVIRRFFPSRLRLGVLFLFLLSLAASAIVVRYDATTAFYMPFTRAWELLLGTMIALGTFPRFRSTLARNAATIVGMGLILYSIHKFTKLTPFPGTAALIPCIGSALIIGAGEFGPSLMGSLLSWRPIVFIGLISYSLYLWHWPVIFLHALGLSINLSDILPQRWASALPAFRFDMVMEIVFSIVLGALSWRFVERPFRSRPLRIARRPLFAWSIAVMLVLISFSATVIFGDGFKWRYPEQAVKIASYLATHDAGSFGKVGGCFITESNRSAVLDNDDCLRLEPGKKNYLLIGDSHAGALWSGLQAAMPDDHFLLASVSNCKPLIHSRSGGDCGREMDYIYGKYLPSHAVEGLMLEARWHAGDMAGLSETIEWAKQRGLPVIVFGPVAEYDAPLPRLLAYSIAKNEPDLARRHLVALSPQMDKQMQLLATDQWHVRYVSLYHAMCGDTGCIEYADDAHDIPLMDDTDHLNENGSTLIAKKLVAQGELQ